MPMKRILIYIVVIIVLLISCKKPQIIAFEGMWVEEEKPNYNLSFSYRDFIVFEDKTFSWTVYPLDVKIDPKAALNFQKENTLTLRGKWYFNKENDLIFVLQRAGQGMKMNYQLSNDSLFSASPIGTTLRLENVVFKKKN